MSKKKKPSSVRSLYLMRYICALGVFLLFHGIMFLCLGPTYMTILSYPFQWIVNKLMLTQFINFNFISQVWYGCSALTAGFLISSNSTISNIIDKIGEKLLQVKDKSAEAASSVNKFFKTFVVNIMPNIFLHAAERLPIGGWYKYSFSGMNDLTHFHYAVDHALEDQVDRMLKVLPQKTLYKLMQKEDYTGETPLATAFNGPKNNLAIFKKILTAVEPEKRLSILTKEILVKGIMQKPRRLPLVYQFASESQIPFLQVALELLEPKDRIKLIHTKTNIGDNLFHHLGSEPLASDVFPLYLSYLNHDQIKILLNECCPHGYTPLMNRIKACSIKGVKPFFDCIPKEIHDDILKFKANDWTMSHGEKLLWMAQDDCLGDNEVTQYLKQNFNLEHSASFRALDKEQLQADLTTMVKNREKNSCIQRDRFLKQYGKYPEELLGIEVDSRPQVYTNAFKKLLLKHHPDKNQNIDDGMSAKITAAKKFITDIDARKEKQIAVK